MSSKFVIQIKEGKIWLDLSVFEYDENSRLRRERRIGALDHTLSSIVGWQRNYHRFRTTPFRVIEHQVNGKKRTVDLTKEVTALLQEQKRRAKEDKPKPKAVPKPTGLSRRQVRRAAKKLAIAAEGTKANWRKFLTEATKGLKQ
jgi:hypothetical protein